MSLSYNGHTLANLRAENLNGQAVIGGYCLTFSVLFSKQTYPQPGIEVRGLRLRVDVERLSGGQARLLGFASCAPHWTFTVHQYQQPEYGQFDLILSEGQLTALEDFRGNDGLRFRISVSGAAIGPQGSWPLQDDIQYDANLSRWIELLKAMGAAEYLTIAVLLPSVAADDPYAPAVERVRGAHKFLLQGEYDTAVAESRKALEALQQVEGKPTRNVFDLYQKNHRGMSRTDRHALLQSALFHLANLAHHHRPDDPEVFSRNEARLVVSAVAGLLSSAIARGNEGTAPIS